MDKRKAYLDWINRYCNTNYYDEYVDEETQETIPTNIPDGLEIILQDMINVNPADFGVTSEKAEGLSVTYADNALSGYKLALTPYRRFRAV